MNPIVKKITNPYNDMDIRKMERVLTPEQSYKSSHLYGKEWKRKRFKKK